MDMEPKQSNLRTNLLITHGIATGCGFIHWICNRFVDYLMSNPKNKPVDVECGPAGLVLRTTNT